MQKHMAAGDLRLLRFLNHSMERSLIRHSMVFASRLGDGVGWYVTALLVLLVYGKEALTGLAAAMLSAIICVVVFKVIKRHTTRLRPYEVMTDLHTVLPPLDAWSFPSGHSMNALSVAVVVTMFFPLFALLVWPLAIFVALSRVALGLHYPSDVLVGSLMGAAISLLSSYLVLFYLS